LTTSQIPSYMRGGERNKNVPAIRPDQKVDNDQETRKVNDTLLSIYYNPIRERNDIILAYFA